MEYISFWDKKNIRYHIHNYDDFINNKKEYMINLFNFIGLDFKDNFLDIKKNLRPVLTASNTQIRSDIKDNQNSEEIKILTKLYPEFFT